MLVNSGDGSTIETPFRAMLAIEYRTTLAASPLNLRLDSGLALHRQAPILLTPVGVVLHLPASISNTA